MILQISYEMYFVFSDMYLTLAIKMRDCTCLLEALIALVL